MRAACSHIVVLLALALNAADVSAAEAPAAPRKQFTVPHTEHPPVLDGKVDAAEWRDAAVLTDLTQVYAEGQSPSEATEFLVMRDADNLYIAARLRDREPAKIVHSQRVQGQSVVGDDNIEFYIDPYLTRRTGYLFYVNPNGVQRDGLALQGDGFNMDWNGIWQARASIDDQGWQAEVVLPFKTLPFNPDSDRWGINFVRFIPRRGEYSAWSHRNRSLSLDIAGDMLGMRGASQGRGLDVVPSIALTQAHSTDGRDALSSKPSLDVFWRVNPALTASLTLNTDFSATEVDDRQVNLTRFSLFFPEKRQFFLEDASTFDFADLTENGRPFFSRTIGLSSVGQPVDLDGGVKITGRSHRVGFGALAVHQAAQPGADASWLMVGRAYASLFEQSTIGAIVTVGDPARGTASHLGGLDLNYRARRGRYSTVVDAGAWYQQSSNPGSNGDDGAWGLRAGIGAPNDRVDIGVKVTEIQRNFRPALGFVNRVGIRQYDARAKQRLRLEGTPLRDWQYGVESQQVYSIDGPLESRSLKLVPANLLGRKGDMATIEYSFNHEHLTAPFLLPGGLRVAAGNYDFQRFRAWLKTAEYRKVQLLLETQLGNFYGGRRTDTRVGVIWQPHAPLYLNAQYLTNSLTMPGGRFIARTYSLGANLPFNVRWAWLNTLQYDNVSRRMGLNSRLRWVPELGKVAYLVVNYDWLETDDGSFIPRNRETTLKAGYTFRW